jgi:hypothetical protein
MDVLKDRYIHQQLTAAGVQTDVCSRFAAHAVASVAMDLLRLYTVVQVPDGSNAQGQPMYRLYSAQEAVAKSCEAAEAMMKELSARGWLLDIPEPDPKIDEMNATVQHLMAQMKNRS